MIDAASRTICGFCVYELIYSRLRSYATKNQAFRSQFAKGILASFDIRARCFASLGLQQRVRSSFPTSEKVVRR